jgi:hypothetical protein
MWPWPWAISAKACCYALPALKGAGNEKGRLMTNRIALVLGFLIICAIVADYIYYGTEHTVFLAKKMTDLIEWLAFWR